MITYWTIWCLIVNENFDQNTNIFNNFNHFWSNIIVYSEMMMMMMVDVLRPLLCIWKQATDTIKSHNELVKLSCTKSKKVTVSRICQPLNCSDVTQDKFKRVNAGLLNLTMWSAFIIPHCLGNCNINNSYFIQDDTQVKGQLYIRLLET